MDRMISVVGHTALDYIVDVERIAGKNESSPVIDYEVHPGGGAANIAVAIARLGGNCQLISPIGGDFESSGSFFSITLPSSSKIRNIFLVSGETGIKFPPEFNLSEDHCPKSLFFGPGFQLFIFDFPTENIIGFRI